MNNLFTMLSLGEKYTKYSVKLVNNLLERTPHDVRISTDHPLLFQDINNTRLTVIDITEKVQLNLIGLGGFNYNLKFYAFENIPTHYDTIFYLDCDQEITMWDDDRFQILINSFFEQGKDFIATRTDAILRGHIQNYRVDKQPDLFAHKIENYGLTFENTPEEWLDARMPSEHFFILKNDPKKIKVFYFTWKMLNALSEQLKDKNHGTWGDGFEIGIAAKNANYTAVSVGGDIQAHVFGINFNGNKNEN